MFKFVIYASTICIINIYINFLKKKNNDVNTTNTSTEYVLQIPAAFKRVAMLLFGFGMFMFVFFYLFKISGNKTVSAGHLYLALVLATMGLLANIWADQWNVQVNGTDIIIHTLFKKMKLSINDIADVKVGKKFEIVLYDASHKKIITIDGLVDNYDHFVNTLKTYGKLKLNVN